jgi:hypothetical protein
MPINPEINGAVNSIAINSNSIFIGGMFNQVGGVNRNNLVEIDKQTGIPTLFDPSPSGEVKTIAMAQNSLFVGGSFNYTINNEVSNFVELNLSGDFLSTIKFNNTVNSLVISSDTVIAGGVFSSFNGQIRHNFAALDYESGALLSYAPDVNDEIKSIQLYGNNIAIGGVVQTITPDGSAVAAIDWSTGNYWNLITNDSVARIDFSNVTVGQTITIAITGNWGQPGATSIDWTTYESGIIYQTSGSAYTSVPYGQTDILTLVAMAPSKIYVIQTLNMVP